MSEKVQKIRQEIERKIEICEKYSLLNLTEETSIGNHAQLLELREIRDFIDSLSEEPDLQSFRNQAAKDILCAMVPGANNIISPGIVEYSIMIADELIRQLKEKGVETIDKKQCEQKSYMIQWKGNNLKEIVEFTGKSQKFNDWFKTWEEYENYVHAHNNIFKLFNEDGSHFEIPVGAWIVKTPDGYNIPSCFKFIQKPDDKIGPKFKVGDWITNGEYIWNVTDIKPLDYVLQSQNGDTVDDIISYVDEQFHLWTIEDAKDGDVLANGDVDIVLIFKCFAEPSYRQYIIAHIGLDASGDIQVTDEYWNLGFDCGKPATKEQCDILFQKMKEAGYVWYADKKELKK